jgi:poly(hydroxyalkanoate) depolymerase family esterase
LGQVLLAVAIAAASLPVGGLAGQATSPPGFCQYGPAAGPGVTMGVRATSPAQPGTGYTRDYCVHLPANYGRSHGAMPLVMVLHGCYTDAPTVAYESRFNQLADARGFITVYPQQSATVAHPENPTHPYDGNGSGRGKGSGCWNWHMADQWQRNSPEPWLLAAITNRVMHQYRVDSRRVYVTGISAGGAMSNLLAVLYPDLYASVAVLAGCEYGGALCLGSVSGLPPSVSGQLAYQAAGSHARVVPFLVENGDIDPVVPVVNALAVTQQWQVYDGLARSHGNPSALVPAAPCATVSHPAGALGPPDTTDPANNPNQAQAYDTYFYSLDGAACKPSDHDLGELWIVHGELHAWPGGAPRRYFSTEDSYYDIWTDPLGPDLTRHAYDFFMAHPMTGGGGRA